MIERFVAGMNVNTRGSPPSVVSYREGYDISDPNIFKAEVENIEVAYRTVFKVDDKKLTYVVMSKDLRQYFCSGSTVPPLTFAEFPPGPTRKLAALKLDEEKEVDIVRFDNSRYQYHVAYNTNKLSGKSLRKLVSIAQHSYIFELR